MRPHGEEEVYLTTIVVRRPVGHGGAPLDHTRLSRAILQCMAAQSQAGCAPAPEWASFPPARQRYLHRSRRRQYTIQPVYLGLSFLCLALTGYCLYALLR